MKTKFALKFPLFKFDYVERADGLAATKIRQWDKGRVISIIEREGCNIVDLEETYCLISKLYFKDAESMMNFQLKYL
jgi:hypothetical protein